MSRPVISSTCWSDFSSPFRAEGKWRAWTTWRVGKPHKEGCQRLCQRDSCRHQAVVLYCCKRDCSVEQDAALCFYMQLAVKANNNFGDFKLLFSLLNIFQAHVRCLQLPLYSAALLVCKEKNVSFQAYLPLFIHCYIHSKMETLIDQRQDCIIQRGLDTSTCICKRCATKISVFVKQIIILKTNSIWLVTSKT